jgi:hypothetical protein
MRHGKAIGRTTESEYLRTQVTSDVKGSDIVFTDGKYRIVGGAVRKECTSKGIRVRTGSAGGVLVVHLADNPADYFSSYDLVAGDEVPLGADYIIQAGTTIVLDDNVYVEV